MVFPLPMKIYSICVVGWYNLDLAPPGGQCGWSYTFYVPTETTDDLSEADFNVAIGPDNCQVTFTDLSTGDIDSWYWYFGDGAVSEVSLTAFGTMEANNLDALQKENEELKYQLKQIKGK